MIAIIFIASQSTSFMYVGKAPTLFLSPEDMLEPLRLLQKFLRVTWLAHDLPRKWRDNNDQLCAKVVDLAPILELWPNIGRWANFGGHVGCHVHRGLKLPCLALLANQFNYYTHCYTHMSKLTL